MNGPGVLYHGSPERIEGALRPVLRHGSEDHVHHRAAVFATERADVASLFMVPADALSSFGFEQDVAYICIWGTSEEFARRDPGGWLYELPAAAFEKIGKSYEWQCFADVAPVAATHHPSVIDGMLGRGAQVYFVDDDPTFDRIVADKADRSAVLSTLVSENERRGMKAHRFVPPGPAR